MKKNICFLTLLCCLTGSLSAQNYYSLTTGISTYSDLSNPVVIASDTLVQGYNYSDSLVFPFYGYDMDFRMKPSLSTGLYIDKDGFVAAFESSCLYTDILDVAYGNFRIRDASTSLSLAYEGQRGSGVLKVQWKNMGIEGHQNTDYVNFQMWFNEANNSISFHYGPSHITGSFNPVVGLMRASNTSDTFTHSTFIKGNSSNPSGLSVYYSRTLPVYPIAGFPPNGTVYTLKSKSSGLEEADRQMQFSIYPNPANSKLYFSFNNKPVKVNIYDMSGKCVLVSEPHTNEGFIDLSSLQKGLYMVQAGTINPIRISLQ